MLKKIGFVFFLVITLFAMYALFRLEFSQPGGEVSTAEVGGGELTCSATAFREYQSKMVEIGDMTIASQPYDNSVAKQKEALANYLAKRPDGLNTVIASVHVPSGEIFTTTCKEEKCTMKEIGQADYDCMYTHMGNCSYIAVRFRGQDMCLLDPAQEQ